MPAARSKAKPLPSSAAFAFGTSGIGCYGINDGFVNIQVNDGTAPFSFNWSTGDTTQNIDSLAPGTYIVEVIDSNNLLVSDTFALAWLDSISISETHIDEHCVDGSIDITVTGGTVAVDYIYKWEGAC